MMQRTNEKQTSSTMLTIRPNGDRPCLHCRGASDYLFIHESDFDDVCDAKFLHYGGTGFIRAMEDGQGEKLLKHAKSRGYFHMSTTLCHPWKKRNICPDKMIRLILRNSLWI